MKQLTRMDAEKRIAQLGMDDMPLMPVRPAPHMVAPDWFAKYRALAREFMQSLTDSVQELAMMNLPQDEFMGLIMGRAMPSNLSLRMRVPLVWGGKLEISNMFLCQTFPHSHNIDRFIIEQSGANEIWMPDPAKKIYLPAHTLTGGEGGNATTDRLTQIAAQSSARDM